MPAKKKTGQAGQAGNAGNNDVLANFDLGNVLGTAQKAVEDMASQSNFGDMKLIYPSDGELRVRLMLSPQAGGGKGMATRLIHRHTVGDSKVPCLNDYGMECDVCRVLQQIKNFNNADLWKYDSTARGLAYAQYVSSNYKGRWTKDNPEPEEGEIVLLMFPWTVYGRINEALVSSAQAPRDILLNHMGTVLEISRYIEDGNVRYEVSTDGSTYKSAEDNTAMSELIKTVPNLDEAIQNAEKPSDKQLQANKSASMSLAVKFGLINPMAGQGHPQTASQAFTPPPNHQPHQPQYPPQGQVAPPPQQAPPPSQGQVGQPQMGAAPECFGKYDKTSRKCIAQCSYDIQCAMLAQA